MILAKGQLLPDSSLGQILAELPADLAAARALPAPESEWVIAAIEGLLEQLDSGALDPLLARFATPKMLAGLEDIRPTLSRPALEHKLAVELGGLEAEKVFPLGVLFHVTAGNVAGLSAFSAVEGLLTGNINLIKLPREDRGLTVAILSRLVEQEPRLAPFLYAFDIPSKDTPSLQALAALADGMAVWGGDEAVRACRAMAPVGCKLMEWGHRLGFAYIAGFEDRERELAALAGHLISTGGLLCSSCQVIYLDTDDMEKAAAFCRYFLPILEGAVPSPAPLSEMGQRTLYAYESALEHIIDHADRDAAFFPGRGCSLTLCRDGRLELSGLHGNVLVKCLPRQELTAELRREKGRLQTAGLLCPPEQRAALTDLLARAGVTRITRAGSMSNTFPGENHDGEYSLRRYIRIVDIET